MTKMRIRKLLNMIPIEIIISKIPNSNPNFKVNVNLPQIFIMLHKSTHFNFL
jgi:hypothetical protein